MELSDHSRLEDESFDALPPPLSPGHDHGDPFGDGGENGEVSRLDDVPEAKRKGVKRPQPKLDSNRLISERGLPALRTLFNDVHFKGKGHEVEDLRLLMQKMENWAHRLYPKLQFEDFIDKLEKLGSKKEVQTCLKRIRLDMPLTHEDFTVNEGEEEPVPEVQIFGDPDPFGGEHLRNSPPRLVHSTPAPGAPPVPSSSPSLTEEQRKRIEFNRLKALERRLARQLQETESKPDPAEDSINVSTEKTPSHSPDQEEATEKTPSHSPDQEEATEKTPSHSQDQEEATEKTPSHSQDQEEATEKTPSHSQGQEEATENAPSHSQDQEEAPDFNQDSLSSSTQHNSQPPSEDSETPVESTQAHKPETSPSPVHEPDNICEEEE